MLQKPLRRQNINWLSREGSSSCDNFYIKIRKLKLKEISEIKYQNVL